MMRFFKITLTPTRFSGQSLCYASQGHIWLSKNGNEAHKVSVEEFKKKHVWHNTTLICPPSQGSSEPLLDSTNLISETSTQNLTVYDYSPDISQHHVIQQLNLKPANQIGSVGLATVMLAKYKNKPNESLILMLSDRVIINQYKQNHLHSVHTIKLRFSQDMQSLVATLVPKLIQRGVGFDKKNNQLIYDGENYGPQDIKTITKILNVSKKNTHEVASFPKAIMQIWWDMQIKPIGKAPPLPIPRVSIVSVLLAAVLLISAQLIDSHKQYYRVNKRKMEALKDHSNLGQLNTLGKYATKGPQALLKKMQGIPNDAWLDRFIWTAQKKAYVSGYCSKPADIDIIRNIVTNVTGIPAKQLPIKRISGKPGGTLHWSIGSYVKP